MKKEIVFSDYDGTIYIVRDEMCENVKAIGKYRDLGGKFVIITGRSKTSASNVIKEYHIPYDYVICNNGAIIFNRDMEKIYDQGIPTDITDKIIRYLETKKNIEIFFYDEADKIPYHHQELLKIRIRTTDYTLAQTMEDEINRLFGEDIIVHSAFPGMYYDNHDYVIIDIVSRKAGKENAIKKLLEILNMQKEQVVTMGDGRNDIAMIREYNGYSMETAENEVKKVASKIFKNIAEALEYLRIN